MSKEADKEAREASSAAEDRRRRRRKGGGLRVPSDNVPRRSEGEMAAPAPEDPHLAVSVAYAFGANEEPEAAAESSADEAGDGATDQGWDEADLESRRTQQMPAISVGGLASTPSGDSVDISFDEEAPPEAAATPAPAEADAAAAEAAPAEPAAAAAEVAPADAAPAPAPAEAAPAEPAPAAPRPPRQARAQTMALSDEDLEELRVAVEARGAGRPATAEADDDGDDHPEISREDQSGQPDESGRPETAADGAPVAGDAEVPVAAGDAGSGAVAAPVPGDVAAGEATAATPEASEVPAPVARLEESAIESPVAAAEAPAAPAEPGDSGEIIADDLIEEVDEEAVGSAAADPPPPPRRAGTEPPRAPTDPPPPPVEGAASSRPAQPPPAPKPKENAARAAAVAAAATPQKARRRKARPWFEEIFTEDYLRTLPFLTPQATQREANFVIDSLESDAGAQVLDVGCGYGRHAMELAARGYHVVALDASLPLLLRGADEAQRRGLTINFVHGDMRELTFDSQFDGAYCLFSTFGYFDDETNKKAAQNIARALKPQGRLVIQILNRDYLIGDLPARVWWEGDGCVVLEEVEFNYFSSRIVSNRSVVFDDGRQLEQEISVRAYSLHEFGKLLHAAGFRVIEISGTMETRGRFFGNQSREIIVVAEKRAGSAAASNGASPADGAGSITADGGGDPGDGA